MSNVSLLDCTLRDGGYVNNWLFTREEIWSTVTNLTDAGINYVEMGYLTSITSAVGGTQFVGVKEMSEFLPENRKNSIYLAMADCSLYDIEELEYRSNQTIDCIRVVFYKRQIEQAFRFCKGVVSKGYGLIIQPMVTVDYSVEEFEALIRKFSAEYPLYSVAVVDSFGCMDRKQVKQYVNVLDSLLQKDIRIGFHGHNNMNMAMQNALAFIEVSADREIIIDGTVNGIGRGAGNLCTEVMADYCNMNMGADYVVDSIINVMSDVTEPISREKRWGYTPYYMLTARHKAHPNFANFLKEKHDVSVKEFCEILEMIPKDMLTRCTKPIVEELYQKYTGR